MLNVKLYMLDAKVQCKSQAVGCSRICVTIPTFLEVAWFAVCGVFFLLIFYVLLLVVVCLLGKQLLTCFYKVFKISIPNI